MTVPTYEPSTTRLTASGLRAWTEFAVDEPDQLSLTELLAAGASRAPSGQAALVTPEEELGYTELAERLDDGGVSALLAAAGLGSEPGTRSTGGDWATLGRSLASAFAMAPDDVVGVLPGADPWSDLRRLLPAWASGATVVVAGARLVDQFSPLGALSWAARERVTHLDVGLPWWHGALATLEREDVDAPLPSVRRFVLGGPAPAPRLVQRWLRRVRNDEAVPWSLFQVPETSHVSLRHHRAQEARLGLVGRPAPGSKFAVVDTQGRLCSPLVAGTVCCGDVRGAWSSTSATGRLVLGPGGDWEIEVLSVCGDADPDRAALEAAMWGVDGVVDGVVLTPRNGTHRLLVVGDDSTAAALRGTLPGHLRAAEIQTVTTVPRRANGDPDLVESEPAGLPTAGPGAAVHRTEAVDSALTAAVRQLWAAVLDVPRVEDVDDFFRLGGSSLTALRLTAELRRDLGLHVRAGDVYGRSRFDTFVSWLDGRASSGAVPDRIPALPFVEVETVDELVRILVGCSLDQPPEADAAMVEGTGHRDPDLGLVEGFHHITMGLSRADTFPAMAAQLLTLHPLLRSHAVPTETGWAHALHRQDPPLVVLDTASDVAGDLQAVRERLVAAYDPATQPPVRIGVVRDVPRDRAMLNVWISHTVCDGEGAALLTRQIRALADGQGPAAFPTTVNELENYARTLREQRSAEGEERERWYQARFQSARAALLAALPSEQPPSPATWSRRVEADPIGGLATMLAAIAEARGLRQLPLLCDFHGRVDPGSLQLVGNYAGFLPAVLDSVSQGLVAVREQLEHELQLLRARYPNWRSVSLGNLDECVRVSIFEGADGPTDVDRGLPDDETEHVREGVEVTLLLTGEGADLHLTSPWSMETALAIYDRTRRVTEHAQLHQPG